MSNTLKLGNGQWATGKDTVLSFSDTNNNYKPLPFSFSRASSGTVVNKDGLIETVGSGEPRIDFKDNTKGALLLEPTRSNVITYSENLNGAGWNVYSSTGGTCTRTLNYGISPSGKQDSTRVVFSTGTTALYFSSNITGNASATMYVKGISGEVIGFGWGESVASGTDFTFNGEWQRLEYNGTSANSTLSINDWGETRNARDFEIYGVQMEEGSYATSYIPTSGSAVTRVGESCYQGGLLDKGILNNNAMTLYFENDNQSDTSNNYLETISLYNDLNNIGLRLETRTNNQLYVQQSGVVSSGSNFNSFSLGVNSVNLKKIAIYLTTTQFKVFADGNQIYSTYNGTYVLNFNNISFRQNNGSVETKIQNKEIKLYNTALTDAELIALTKI
jgi:hypothetical protein